MDPRDERIAQLEAELAQLQTGVRDAQLRAQAEVENIRRRTEIDVEKAHKFALEKFANELLPVIDSLERALEVADKENPALASMIEGIELTLKSLLGAVRKFGVEVVGDTNVPFNPEIHQAMSMMESDDVAPNHVMMVMQRGYTLNGRLLRFYLRLSWRAAAASSRWAARPPASADRWPARNGRSQRSRDERRAATDGAPVTHGGAAGR